MVDYENKYLKYKNKYKLLLNNNIHYGAGPLNGDDGDDKKISFNDFVSDIKLILDIDDNWVITFEESENTINFRLLSNFLRHDEEFYTR